MRCTPFLAWSFTRSGRDETNSLEYCSNDFLSRNLHQRSSKCDRGDISVRWILRRILFYYFNWSHTNRKLQSPVFFHRKKIVTHCCDFLVLLDCYVGSNDLVRPNRTKNIDFGLTCHDCIFPHWAWTVFQAQKYLWRIFAIYGKYILGPISSFGRIYHCLQYRDCPLVVGHHSWDSSTQS